MKPNSTNITTVNAYLTFIGNFEEAFNFYKSRFGGDFPFLSRYKDIPADSGKPVPAEDADKIMRIALPVSKETVLMGSDTGGKTGQMQHNSSSFTADNLRRFLR